MKTMKIFLRDMKINLREFFTLWIILIPIALAAIIHGATPGITDSFLSVAMLKDAPAEKTAFYERYASVERFDTVDQMEQRVMGAISVSAYCRTTRAATTFCPRATSRKRSWMR